MYSFIFSPGNRDYFGFNTPDIVEPNRLNGGLTRFQQETCALKQVRPHAHVHAHTKIKTEPQSCAPIHTCTHVFVCTHNHTKKHTHTVHVHTCTHAHRKSGVHERTHDGLTVPWQGGRHCGCGGACVRSAGMSGLYTDRCYMYTGPPRVAGRVCRGTDAGMDVPGAPAVTTYATASSSISIGVSTHKNKRMLCSRVIRAVRAPASVV